MLHVEVNKIDNKFSVIIYNCIYEQKVPIPYIYVSIKYALKQY